MFSMKIWCVKEDLVAVLGGAFVGRALFPASVSGSPSSERTPPLPSGLVAGPSSASPSVPAVSSSSAPTMPAAVGTSSESPPVVAGSVPEDADSLQEGRGSFYESTLREVWINGYVINIQHRFTSRTDEVRSRFIWTMTARSNFKHLMYNARKNAEKHSQSADPTLWRERAPSWMRGEYWETLCNIWAAERWQQTSSIMKVNRAANPEVNMHTGGSVSFTTHQSRLEKELKRQPTFSEVFDRTHKKKGTDAYISDRARVVAESYSQQMTEKYVGEDEQPPLDPEVPSSGGVGGHEHEDEDEDKAS
ncbi:hypothetical protein Taro_032266 [Colocasia esculenta]|uniref:Uncharacterized protein n=1 Tax=Colocasia esculenta TaxID=4460 RepID=A0A843VKY1_COLES|nr:hypothetical protein [Colocasia esculenta]